MQTLSLIPECVIQVSSKDDGNIASYEDLVSLSPSWKEKSLYLPEHRHGTDVVILTKENVESPPVAGDIIVTALRDVVIAHQYADCVPFLCIDRKKKAFVFSHLGWKGLTMGGIQVSILALQAEMRSEVSDLWVWIGPCIQRDSYVFDTAPIQSGLPAWDGAIEKIDVEETTQWKIDLPGFIMQECARIGVDPAQVINDGRDTYELSDIFFSHRRSIEEGKDCKGSFVVAVSL